MAAGDNASRANRFDVAREWLTQARDELERLGVTYYALRSEGSLCTVLARQSDVDAAIACESRLIPRWIANGERRETAVRQISAGNLSLRAGRLPAARQFFLDAEQSASVLSPVLLSRLSAGLGNYELMLGNFPAAATHYARAVHRLGNAGIPDEQTNLDMRLALLASVAGALPDQIRLLESAQKRLSEANDPIRLGEVNLLLAKPLLRLGDPQKALSAARTASRLCSAAENRRCIELATLIEIETLAALDPSAAEKKLAELPALSEPSANGRRIYLEAKVQLALAKPSESLRLLGRLNLQRNDLELQTDVSLLRAESLQQLGQRENAMTELGTAIRAESEAVSDWSSVALVISARAYLVELQSAFFDLALAASGESAQTSGLDAIRSVVQATDPRRLLQRRSATTLPESVRRKLSASIIENRLDSRREAFAAMTQGTAQTQPRLVPAQRPAQPSPNHQTVLLPAIGKEGFSLLAVSGTQVQTCLRWTASRYRDLAARFSNVLDGADGDVAGLHEAAAELHGAVRACGRGNVGNWHVVKLPGVPLLPWSWIAAAGPATDEEPTVTISFTLPDTWDSALAKPASLLLLDLDMPSVAPLPLASVEADTLSSELSKKGIDAQHLRASELSLDDIDRALAAADVVHIVGHANPATFGSLYQGLWFESRSAGTLITYPEIAGRDLRAELVVLSACGTRPDQAGSQFAWSLAEAFVAAGAQRVVSAANPLSDAAGPLWTKTFHDTVWRTGDAAIAARSARQALRKSPHFRHPKFWAGIDYFISAGEKPPVQVDDSSSVRHDNEE
ncbi:MAG TPA: CHAT domain-containing protein [Tahibacter sp.]|nr:CHAT domain-containing protein [Tahibacter sp.]